MFTRQQVPRRPLAALPPRACARLVFTEPRTPVLAAMALAGLVAATRRKWQVATKLVGAVLLLAAVATISPRTAFADPITVPTGLHPGDPYRLAFVTSTTTNTTSTNIGDYNAFVTTVANSVPQLAALGTTWSAIASTPTVDARDNTSTNPLIDPVGVPIYTLANTLIAPTNSALWSGTHANALNIYQSGVTIPYPPSIPYYVATGTLFNGVGDTAFELGDNGVLAGIANSLHPFEWMEVVVVPTANDPGPFYAMSGVMTVVPEPSTGVLAVIACGIMWWWRKRLRSA